ncbi:PbsX family transcriptional regulator [Streptomyces rimosus subsp. pseudoverticillatus]|uniref:penicillin acylase family protein n=1 Tax=Streptomyces rimosus TaxID=1927 RepID=UPI0006B294D3|nr:penicillin acylase family protein [Streptomyces rimosus]KOT88336.1 PbsX family transcriptional regulator [Streptomyces rimosus subsp. pseudoverticillatus]
MPPHSDNGTTPGHTTYDVPGLAAPVEIRVDRWGVPHLYAASQDDLFLAQGFNAARDRLFQIDLWRRRGLGLLSEVFGESCLEHDRAARLFLYRGDMAAEWAAYGPRTECITSAFVRGVNAYVALCRADPAHLPPEFALLGHRPAYWEPADVARIRSHGLYYNLEQEVARALTLRDHGPAVEDLRRAREPAHTLRVPDGLDLSVIPDDVLRVYRLATNPPWEDGGPRQGPDGSNNWVIAPSRTATGRPLLANDPHRAVTLPALRYLAHLSAPGIDAIGAGEPALPGISIGHNGRIAFGLTIFPIDQEDLYVYRTNPDAPREYRYDGRWEPMTRVTETVPVRDGRPVTVELWFTRHGPVIHEDPERGTAFAVRAAWLGPGMAPYLGSTQYMTAEGPDAFVAALRRWGAPGENQVYAAPDGTIGWQPAGRVPARPNWDGTLPVPGDGRYEWAGFHPADTLPSVRDPGRGWFATANEMNLPPGYPNARRTITYDWYAPIRHDRIAAELDARTGWTVADCVRLQTDCTSLSARRILPLLTGLTSDDPDVDWALGRLRAWDARLAPDSVPAALFEVWYRRHLRPAVLERALGRLLPPDRRAAALARVLPAGEAATTDPRIDLGLLLTPGDRLGPAPDRALRTAVLTTLPGALAELGRLLGPDRARWTWGALHQAEPRHPLAGWLGERAPDWTRAGPVPRGGSGDTVGATSYGTDFRQAGGATFRLVIDVGDWDASVAMNAPGQSGVPDSPHYRDLFADWAADRAFPLLYGRTAVARHTTRVITLRPAGGPPPGKP